jgi:rod shape-determining protein MreC
MKGNSLYTLRRWWDRHGSTLILASLALVTAGLIRQTKGAAILEIYQLLARPFAASPARQAELTNARIRELEERLAESDRQNQALQDLIDSGKKSGSRTIFAPVVGRTAHHWWQQVILGRGHQAGLNEGDIVTAPGGLVGRLTNVTANSSQVLLLTDPSSRVGVTIGRSRAMGVLYGQNTDRAVMEFFDKVPDVKPGDLVFTSSLSKLFPGGTPVGRVESVDLKASPAPEATIALSSPVNALEWVTIYPKKDTESEFPGIESPPEPNPSADASDTSNPSVSQPSVGTPSKPKSSEPSTPKPSAVEPSTSTPAESPASESPASESPASDPPASDPQE